MKALSLIQPWASLLFAPPPWRKRFETRGWFTSYRGLLAIHASGRASFEREQVGLRCAEWPFNIALKRMGFAPGEGFPFGAIIGVVDLADCIGTSGTQGQRIIEKLSSTELAFGDFREGRFMWDTQNPRLLRAPISCRGQLNLWDAPEAIAARIEAEINVGGAV